MPPTFLDKRLGVAPVLLEEKEPSLLGWLKRIYSFIFSICGLGRLERMG